MPPRPSTVSIRNPATSVPMRVGGDAISGGRLIIPLVRGLYRQDGLAGHSLPVRGPAGRLKHPSARADFASMAIRNLALGVAAAAVLFLRGTMSSVKGAA